MLERQESGKSARAAADLKWLRNAEHFGEWGRFDEVTGERESIWMMKSKSSPKVRFYGIGKGQIGQEHPSVVAASYWAYGTGYLGVIEESSEIFLEIACREEVLSGGAVKPDIADVQIERVDREALALDVLLRLSEASTDGRLRDAIALVRSALHDEVEEHFCGSTICDGGCQERAVEQFDRGQM